MGEVAKVSNTDVWAGRKPLAEWQLASTSFTPDPASHEPVHTSRLQAQIHKQKEVKETTASRGD